MKIDLSAGEIWDLLKQGSSNQRNFIDLLYYSEFEEFIMLWEEVYNDFDLISCLNGGCLFVEDPDEAEEDYIIYNNGRIIISLY